MPRTLLARWDPMWMELDLYEPAALREVKDATTVPICSGENLFGLRGYRPYLDARAMDVVMIDVPWNGFVGANLDEAVARKHVWEPGRLPGYSVAEMYRR